MEEKPFYFAISKQYEPDYRKSYLVSNYMEIRCNQSWTQETSWYTEACQFTPREPFLTNCGAQVKTRQMKTQPSIIKELSQDLEPNESFYEVTKLCGSQHLHRLKIGPYVHDKQEEQLK
ncbi:hypothetical protein NC653_001636 [Populus alba x Populus x berolinensis]|uniref:Uncharacterized protein n=1 Tax=Populus alba x Populus x berolinensis TaxID=444605 RepID=A0AAD6RM09_9ROSI|nr:hypothetical protein NC653_001636 [Populus alba x Populus x berolinensis]